MFFTLIGLFLPEYYYILLEVEHCSKSMMGGNLWFKDNVYNVELQWYMLHSYTNGGVGSWGSLYMFILPHIPTDTCTRYFQWSENYRKHFSLQSFVPTRSTSVCYCECLEDTTGETIFLPSCMHIDFYFVVNPNWSR